MNAFGWTEIFRDAVPGIAGVTVYEKEQRDALGKFTVSKTMKLPNGRTRVTQAYYLQRPAALRYAKKFLGERAAKNGLTYAEGDGKNTIMGYRADER